MYLYWRIVNKKTVVATCCIPFRWHIIITRKRCTLEKIYFCSIFSGLLRHVNKVLPWMNTSIEKYNLHFIHCWQLSITVVRKYCFVASNFSYSRTCSKFTYSILFREHHITFIVLLHSIVVTIEGMLIAESITIARARKYYRIVFG